MNRDVIICRCEDVTYGEIADAIDDGLTTTEEIKRVLRCGMGPCQGRTCSRLIARMIAERTGAPVADGNDGLIAVLGGVGQARQPSGE